MDTSAPDRVGDRGSASVLVVLVGLAISLAVLLAVAPVLGGLIDRQRAQSAADAAALGGVSRGRAASAALAGLNGGELVGWVRDGREVTVRVRVGSQVVTARATDGP